MKIIMMWLSFYLLCGFMFQCGSSNKVTSKKSADYNPYFPAAEGNSWEYINEAPREETEQWKVEVKSVNTTVKEKIAEFNSFPFFFKENKPKNIKIKDDGSVYMNDSDKIVPENTNLTKGYTWTFGIWNGSVAGDKETVKAENETFRDCIKINYAASISFTAEIWYARNTGIVKWGFFRTNPPTLTFTYYVLKKSEIH